MSHLRPALVMTVLFTLLTGVIYPLSVTAFAQVAFPFQANASLDPQGSSLIGQEFSEARYFWGRPSAAGYNAAASSGSNYGPTTRKLEESVKARVKALQDADPDNKALVPVDLVTSSGSGLDPHISVAGALYQVGRVARARQLSTARVEQLVREHVEGRTLGVLGEPRVNVRALNLALDADAPARR